MKVATWNMQGASHSTEDKWNKGVMSLLNAPERWRPDALCLQEAGAVPASAKLEATRSFIGPGGATCNVGIYSWGGTERARRRLIYYWWDQEAHRCNLGVITRQFLPEGTFEVGLVWGADGPPWRPAVGIRSGDIWVFSLHAIAKRGPDARPLVEAVQSYARGRAWIAAGDFNREPNTFTVSNATVIPPNGPTYSVSDPVSRYDYLVRKGNIARPRPGTVVSLIMSDHFPAAFEL